MVALVLASESLRKFGGDSVAELVRNAEAFANAVHETPSAAFFRAPTDGDSAPADGHTSADG